MSLYCYRFEPEGDYKIVTISASKERLEKKRKTVDQDIVGEIKKIKNNPDNWGLFQSDSSLGIVEMENKEGGEVLYGYFVKGDTESLTISSSRKTIEDLRHDDNIIEDEEGTEIGSIMKLGTEVTIRSPTNISWIANWYFTLSISDWPDKFAMREDSAVFHIRSSYGGGIEQIDR